MATAMYLEWPGVTTEQYNKVMQLLNLDAKPPAGGTFHVAGFANNTLRVLDVWDSQQAFETFQKDRLAGAVQGAGITTQPKVQYFPVHNIYAPNIELLRRAGASSLPLTV